MRRRIWLLMFIAGLPIAVGLLVLDLFIVAMPQVLYGILYDTDIPEPGRPLDWWMEYCRKHGVGEVA